MTAEEIEEDPHRGPLHHLQDKIHHHNDPRADLLRRLLAGIAMIEGDVTIKEVVRDSSHEAEAAAHTTAAGHIHQQLPKNLETGTQLDWST